MIRRATKTEIPLFFEIADEFYKESEFLEGFSEEVFTKSWEAFLESGLGVLFLLGDGEKDYGVLGAIKYPDPNSGVLIATEMFWYVKKDKRKGLGGIKLLSAFENWAKESECKKMIMVHLADLMPEKVKSLYEHRGYEKMETHFIKEVDDGS